MKKRILSLVMVLTLMAAVIPAMPASAAASISVGQYLEMGTYYGEPILWRCVAVDENGPLMLSDKIICLKPFDAKTSANSATGSHSRSSGRSSWGSNYWADSNMRSWLNSTASAGNVNWLCGNPPSEDYVWSGYNDYANEAGFLTNFASGELGAIKEVRQKSLVAYPESDNGVYTTGTERHDYNYNIADVVQNYDNAYAEYVTDKMFLMDVKQVNAVYNNRGILGDDYYIGEPTAQCVANSEYTSSSLKTGNKWYYWLRSPDANTYSDVRIVSSGGTVYYNIAYDGYSGVRPAFYLNLSSSRFTTGSGTLSAPYRVYGTGGGGSTTVEPAKNITVDNTYSGGDKLVAEAGINANNLLNNITVSNDKLRGPKISVLGKTFYLFELDGKCSISLGNVKIQFKADEKKHTIQMLGGIDFISESMNTGTSYDKGRGIWTKQYNDLKSLYQGLAGGTLNDETARKKFGSVYNAMKNHNSDLLLNIKGNFALYGEIALDEGNIRFNEGGVIVKASASGSIDPRIGGIFYGTFGLSLEASGKFAIKYDGKNKPLAVDAKMTIEPAVNVGVGAGSKAAKLYIEGGLKGKLPIDIAAVTGSFATGANITPFKVTAKGYVYISGKAWVFSADKEWQLGNDVVLYPRNGDVELSSVSDIIDIGDFTLDKSEFKMLPRNYNDEISLMSLSDTFQKTNLYPYSTPQLARLEDGRYLLLWVDDDTSKADADRTSLYYSIFDKTEGYWTSPAVAVENIGYNDLPEVCVDGDNVYIVWAAIDESLGDTTDMDTMTSKLDLYFTFFDGESFAEPELISDKNNGLCEMLYDVSVDESGNITAVWVENSVNDMALSEGTNTVYKRVKRNGAWNGKTTVAAITDEVHDVCLAGDRVVYETGTDTGSDIYMDGVKIGTSENDNSAFKTTDNEVYYLSGTELKTYDIKAGKTASVEMGEITDITILENGKDKTALSLLSTGFTNELYQNEYKDGKWGDWTQLTEYGKYIRDYSASVAEDGSLTVALNLVTVKDEEKGGYGNAELRALSDLEYSDIIVDDAPYYTGTASRGETIDVFCGVTNNSRNNMTSANVKVTAAGGTLCSGKVGCAIAPGATEWISVPVTIPNDFTKQDLAVSVTSDFEENNTDNNTASFTVGYADLAVEDLAVNKTADKLCLEGNISNLGLENADNVIVKLYDNDASGELLRTFTLNTVSAGGNKSFSYELPQSYAENTEGKTTIYVEAVTGSEEYDIGNNSDAVTMADLSEIDTITDVSMSYADNVLTIKSPSAMGVDFYAVYYNADGSLMTCRKLELAIGAGTNNIAVEGLTTGSNVKFMLWDKDMTPLCAPLTWQ